MSLVDRLRFPVPKPHRRLSAKYVENRREQGILCSTALGKEMRAALELGQIFEERLEKNKEESSETSTYRDLDKELIKEIESIRGGNERKKVFNFTVIKGIKCMFFMNLPEEIDPVEFIHSFLDQLKSSERKTRYIQRILPITTICEAKIDAISKAASAVIEKYFVKADPPPSLCPHANEHTNTWGLLTKIRFNEAITKEEIIETLGSLVPPHYTVNLNNSDILLTINIIRSVCLIGICKDYNRLARYNISKVFNLPAEES